MKLCRILIILIVMLLTQVEATENKAPHNLVIGINPNKLLCNVIKQHGLLLAQRELGKINLIKKEDPVDEVLSLLETNDNRMRRGHLYVLKKDDFTVGDVQIGVFIDPNEAYKIFSDHIIRTSMGPNKNLRTELTENSVGWWDEELKAYARVLFVRDNTVVNISLFLKRYKDLGGKAQATLEIAKAVDMSLLEGTHGVKRGSIVAVPRILAVDKPQIIRSGVKTEMVSHIMIPRGLDKGGDYELARLVEFHTPKVQEKRMVGYELTYITSECIVTTKKISITIEPELNTN